MHKKLRYGYRYYFSGHDEDAGPYTYAEPVDYAEGCESGDVWLVDEDGNVDPEYSVSPVSVHISQLSRPRRVQPRPRRRQFTR